jgi:GNAT superfamily N-acetyltransferase
MLEIRVMEHSDLEYATSLTDIEQWGHLKQDFSRLLQLDPAGCFVAWQGTDRAGIATTVSYNGHAFLGNIIVEKKRRGSIIGPALMQHAVYYLDKKGVKTIELDGVFSAIAMYRHMGFQDKYWSLRFIREPAQGGQVPGKLSRCDGSVHEVAEFDYRQTNIQRQALISELVKDFPDHTFCLMTPHLRAYAVVRERANGVLAIGPLIAVDSTACDAMMAGVVSTFGNSRITIGVPGINTSAVQIMLQHDFYQCSPSLRMYRGQKLTYEDHIYGIVSADVG